MKVLSLTALALSLASSLVMADVRHGSWGGGGPTAEVRQVLVNAGSAAVAAVRVFNVNALGVPDCDHSYSCIVVMRRDRFQARS